jgi:Flp pilus assembly protein TadD
MPSQFSSVPAGSRAAGGSVVACIVGARGTARKPLAALALGLAAALRCASPAPFAGGRQLDTPSWARTAGARVAAGARKSPATAATAIGAALSCPPEVRLLGHRDEVRQQPTLDGHVDVTKAAAGLAGLGLGVP